MRRESALNRRGSGAGETLREEGSGTTGDSGDFDAAAFIVFEFCDLFRRAVARSRRLRSSKF